MRILGLDPGESTGFAIINVEGEKLDVIDYGEIAITRPGLDGMLRCVWEWLDAVPGFPQIAFEEFIPSAKMRTTKEAAEVRAIIRLWCILRCVANTWASYYPATVRAQLSVKDKKAARDFAQKAIGFKIRGRDHVSDAFIIAMCHAIKIGAWSLRINCAGGDFSLTRDIAKGRNVKTVDQVETMSRGELAEALRAGKIGVGKGR